MQVQDYSVVGFRAPIGRFPLVISPYFVYTDFPWQSGPENWVSNQTPDTVLVGGAAFPVLSRAALTSDPDLQAVYPAPMFVPHNNCIHAGTTTVNNYTGAMPAQALVQYPQVWRWVQSQGSSWKSSPNFDWPLYDASQGPGGFPPVAVWTPTGLCLRTVEFGVNPLLQTSEFVLPALEAVGGYTDGIDAAGNYGVTIDGTGYIYIDGLNFDVEWSGECQGMWFMFAGITYGGGAAVLGPTGPQSQAYQPAEGVPLGATFEGNQIQSATGFNAEVQFTIGIGTGTDQIQYQLDWIKGNDPIIRRKFYGEGAFTNLRVVPVSGEMLKAFAPETAFSSVDSAASGALATETATTGDDHPPKPGLSYWNGIALLKDKYVRVEFRLIAGRLAVRIGDSTDAYIFDEAHIDSHGNPMWKITYARMWANGLWTVLKVSGHPLKFTQAGYLDSPDIPIGFYSVNTDTPYIDAAGIVPSGWDAYIDGNNSDLHGPIVNYRLVITGPFAGFYKGVPYSNGVAAVRAVNLFWLPQVAYNPAPYVPVNPEVIEVSHEFNVQTLEIASAAQLTFNANRPANLPNGNIGNWGQWMTLTGQGAVDIALSRTIPPGNQTATYQEVFSGYAHVQGDLGVKRPGDDFVMFCEDRRRQLMTEKFFLPWADGWNVFFFMAYLAQQGGVDFPDMAFADHVPYAPFGTGTDLGDGNGGPAYYLPVGAGGSVLTRTSGLKLWELMQRVAYSIGYLLFFDVLSRLQFRKFTVPEGIKRSFTEDDLTSTFVNAGGGLEGCEEIHIHKDMNEVRSDAVVIGTNAFAPAWDPVVFRQQDPGVFNNPSAFNHLGYPNSAVWMDSQFADPMYAYQASIEMITFLRCPGYTARLLTNWSQPDIFPLDMISVNSLRLGLTGVPMLVTSIKHRLDKNRGQSVINARYVPPRPVIQV